MRELLPKFRALKQSQEGAGDDVIAPWDLQFLDRLAAQTSKLDVISDLQKYLPLETTIQKITQRLGDLFGLDFRYIADFQAYATGVKVFQVDDRRTGEAVGILVLDAEARPGKNLGMNYARGINFRLPGQLPVVQVVLNLATHDKWNQTTLSPSGLETVLHELGHGLHFLLAQSPSLNMNGFLRKHDFIEIPSMMMEKLLFAESFWHSIITPPSSDLADLTAVVPMIHNWISHQRSALSSGYLKQAPIMSRSYLQNSIFIAYVDQQLHQMDPAALKQLDLNLFYREQFHRFFGFQTDPADYFLGTFFHPQYGMGGLFYSYLWSWLYVNLLEKFATQHGGVDSPKFMALFRQHLLEPSLLENPDNMLGKLLGGGDIDLDKMISELFSN